MTENKVKPRKLSDVVKDLVSAPEEKIISLISPNNGSVMFDSKEDFKESLINAIERFYNYQKELATLGAVKDIYGASDPRYFRELEDAKRSASVGLISIDYFNRRCSELGYEPLWMPDTYTKVIAQSDDKDERQWAYQNRELISSFIDRAGDVMNELANEYFEKGKEIVNLELDVSKDLGTDAIAVIMEMLQEEAEQEKETEIFEDDRVDLSEDDIDLDDGSGLEDMEDPAERIEDQEREQQKTI